MFEVTLIIIALYGLIVALFNKWYEKLNRKQMEDNAQLTSYMVESLNGIQTIKTSNAGISILENFSIPFSTPTNTITALTNIYIAHQNIGDH